jgi:hypothetical protein
MAHAVWAVPGRHFRGMLFFRCLRHREPVCRGRDTDCSVPPAQIRAGGFPAHGSCLRCDSLRRDAQAEGRIGMADMGRWQPAIDQSFHSLPVHSSYLAPASQHSVPVRAHCEAKIGDCISVTRYSVVAYMPAHH